jgi:hypothetical protein
MDPDWFRGWHETAESDRERRLLSAPWSIGRVGYVLSGFNVGSSLFN